LCVPENIAYLLEGFLSLGMRVLVGMKMQGEVLVVRLERRRVHLFHSLGKPVLRGGQEFVDEHRFGLSLLTIKQRLVTTQILHSLSLSLLVNLSFGLEVILTLSGEVGPPGRCIITIAALTTTTTRTTAVTTIFSHFSLHLSSGILKHFLLMQLVLSSLGNVLLKELFFAQILIV
jgi:formamidopyrimidine-DNA glycosylase